MDNTRSGSEVALIRGPSSTTSVNLGVNGDNITSSQLIDFDFDRLNERSTTQTTLNDKQSTNSPETGVLHFAMITSPFSGP